MKKITLALIVGLMLAANMTASDEAQQLGDTVEGVADVAKNIKKDAKKQVRISANLIPDQLNRSVDNPAAENLIDDTAYHYEVSVLFESNKQDFFGIAQSTHAYFSLHMLKYINSGEDGSYWADSTESLAFVYGHRYYSESDYQGFGYGWYAGLSKWSNSDAYYWYAPNGTVYTDYTDEGVSAIAAGEVFYDVNLENFVATPRAIISIDTNTGELLFAAQFMVGVKF